MASNTIDGHHDGKTIVEMTAEKPQNEGGTFQGDPDYDSQDLNPEERVPDIVKFVYGEQ